MRVPSGAPLPHDRGGAASRRRPHQTPGAPAPENDIEEHIQSAAAATFAGMFLGVLVGLPLVVFAVQVWKKRRGTKVVPKQGEEGEGEEQQPPKKRSRLSAMSHSDTVLTMWKLQPPSPVSGSSEGWKWRAACPPHFMCSMSYLCYIITIYKVIPKMTGAKCVFSGMIVP